jgi:peptidoglycan hydrolase-like protein with peptidoglycan-binding domain
MVQIASRASWGARFRDGDAASAALSRKVVIHHTVTTQLPVNATVAQEQQQMRNLEQIGQTRFGFGISYHVLIFPSGRAYQGVSFNRRGTHTGGHNSTTRGVAFAGNMETNQPSPQALATAAAIVRHGRGRWWVQDAQVKGHRRFRATACPGRHLYAALGQIRNGAITAHPAAPAPAPVAPATGSGVLRQGSTGARVRAMQEGLRRIFPTYNTAPNVVREVGANSIQRLVSGTFGPVTAAWVREFQRRVNLPVTGVVVAATARRMADFGIRGLGL